MGQGPLARNAQSTRRAPQPVPSRPACHRAGHRKPYQPTEVSERARCLPGPRTEPSHFRRPRPSSIQRAIFPREAPLPLRARPACSRSTWQGPRRDGEAQPAACRLATGGPLRRKRSRTSCTPPRIPIVAKDAASSPTRPADTADETSPTRKEPVALTTAVPRGTPVPFAF